MVTYLDRVCISILAPQIMRDLDLTRMQMSVVFSAFALAYAAFEIPTAWWGQRIGTRRVLTRIVIWWSGFTMLTAAVTSYWMLLVVRFLFGVGEAGAWPNVAKTFSHWIPLRQRGTIQGIFFGGAHLSGGITPLIVTALLAWFHWRTIFVLFGFTGLIWAFAWYRWFRDDPAEHRQVNAAELELILTDRPVESGHHNEHGVWGRIFGSASVLGLCLMYFSNGYGFYFLITWLPTYLEQQRGFTAQQLGFFSGFPLILSVVADLTGGVATDWLVRRLGLRLGRAIIGGLSYLVAGIAILVSIASPNPVIAAVLIAVAAAASMFSLGASWAACIDIGGRHAGVVSAAMNTAGQIGAVISPMLLAWLVERFSDWSIPLYLMGGLYLMAAVCWLFINPRRTIQQ
ncbi:MAG: MFS transporter [Acidobacteriia bacterium]|nr:MFS transporter [Terriglobia bacterium]